MSALELMLLFGALLLLIPAAFLLAECLAAPRALPTISPSDAPLPRTTLLIPAHDEAAEIELALASVRAATFPQLEILVIADNCMDATAALAHQAGARVIERTDAAHTGKGYALAFGIESLRGNPPALLMVLDADCAVQPDALRQLAHCALKTGRPVQAIYILRSGANSSPKTAISNFAFLVKNRVRPSGLARLGGPCLLNGSGMAFPWAAVAELDMASGHLSEDMWWSVLLACEGRAPRFCDTALVYGKPPLQEHTLKTQRTRWERGHLSTSLYGLPRLIRAGLFTQTVEPLMLALELAVPPLALLTLLVMLVLAGAALGAMLGGGTAPLCVAALDFMLLMTASFGAWWKFGRGELPVRLLLAVPTYILWKMPLYLNTLARTRVAWTRTARDASPGSEG